MRIGCERTEFTKTEGEESRERIKELRNAFAQSSLFDTSGWRQFCDVSLTLRQARKSVEDGATDRFMNRKALLNAWGKIK
jgi:hypothetical protein